PMSIMVAMGKGASLGVLFKDAEAIEKLREVDTLVVDKTGTLTEGRPKLTSVVTFGETSELQLLRLAASLEKVSEHPLAAAIVNGAKERGANVAAVEEFASLTGRGIRGRVEGHAVALGNIAMMREIGALVTEEVALRAETLRADGQTVMFVAGDGS